jgi:ABC-type polysaccharide/polyol phosphate export permease
MKKIDSKNFKKHENYRHLVWTLAKTDFKLRYHGSMLGYIWALLKPLLMFLVLNFVFSSIFNPRNTGTHYFSLQLLTSIVLFNFFAEGTTAGMMSLMSKSDLVTKIYVPRWTIIFASTLNAAMIFLTNLIIILVFFAYYHFVPTLGGIAMFGFFILLTYVLILEFSFFAAPLYLKFRDLAMIWEVLVTIIFYAAPIVYPLSILPAWAHQIILLNPIAFIIHFMKVGLLENHYPDPMQMALFLGFLAVAGMISFLVYRKLEKRIAENI